MEKPPASFNKFVLCTLAAGGFGTLLVSILALFIGLSDGKPFSHRAVAGMSFGFLGVAAAALWLDKQGDIGYPWQNRKLKQNPQAQPALPQAEPEEEIEEILQQTLQALTYNNDDIEPTETVSTKPPEAATPAKPDSTDSIFQPLPPLESRHDYDSEYSSLENILSPLAPLEEENPFQTEEQDYWS